MLLSARILTASILYGGNVELAVKAMSVCPYVSKIEDRGADFTFLIKGSPNPNDRVILARSNRISAQSVARYDVSYSTPNALTIKVALDKLLREAGFQPLGLGDL